MKIYIFIIALVAYNITSYAQEMTAIFFDPRDGQEYETVIITMRENDVLIKREWFTTNLNYDVKESYCYNNYEGYCETYGRLYSWDAAINACPSGWHLSTDREWEILTAKYGGMTKAATAIKEGGESGVAVIMAGFGEQDGIYTDIGVNGYYWKTPTVGSRSSGLITFHTEEEYMSDDQINEAHRNSIRCVKN